MSDATHPEGTLALEQMRRLESIADVALAHVELDSMLPELLDRVRDALAVDTVAVLLLDEETNELVARAARGLEEEVEAGVRIPFGAGFAGRVAAERAPVFIPDIEQYPIYNPILLQKGVRSMLGVPLLLEGRVRGSSASATRGCSSSRRGALPRRSSTRACTRRSATHGAGPSRR
jgi:signal transduction protein with GAF and PtsI domain